MMISSAKLVLLTFLLFTIIFPLKSQSFSETLNPKRHGLKREKLSHLHFYLHDTPMGRNPTAVRVAESPSTNSSKTMFGVVYVIDDPLTISPMNTSRMVGRAQGFYASASQNDWGLMMAFNFAFTEGKYNGSNLSVLGRNPILANTKEMPVLGGSGLFRFARGYARARTNYFSLVTGDAIVEYDVYVFHY